MAKVTIFIENIPYRVEDNLTILEAAKACGYQIPSLCTFKDGQCSVASCRVCLVKVEGERRLVASCAYPVREGLRVFISDPAAVEARKTSVELLLSNHTRDCQSCRKNGHCELLEAAKRVGVEPHEESVKTKVTIDEVAPAIIRNTGKCILCGRCIAQCKNAQGIGILGFENRGFNTIVAPAGNRSFANVPCIQCGQCTLVCPTGALMEHSEIEKLDEAFREGKVVIVQTAPAVRAALGEEFGDPIGTDAQGKMVAALRRLGFYRVFDTNFGADLTIVEEATELLNRLTRKVPGPMITSCSPGWINFIEYYYPELIPHLSTCKSPHEMMGAIIKSYFAEQHNIDRSKICVVSIMPCVAKKEERARPQNSVDGIQDVDVVLTTRELADLIRRNGIVWKKLPNEKFDEDLIGEFTGAGVIFGVTGGVMEAAVRSAHYFVTNNELEPIDFIPARGFKGIKEATVVAANNKINIAIASGMKNAKVILDQIKAGTCKYDFVEIMGCPGGCVNGGGQPYVTPIFLPNEDDDILDTYVAKRAQVLYNIDSKKHIRVSHKNREIIELYNNYLGSYGSHKAHHLLHTHYNEHRERYPDPKED